MRNWFTSDLHLGHANIIKYCNRPFENLNHMNKEIIRRWNERIKSEDTIFNIGDFCFKSVNNKGNGQPFTSLFWEKKLNGKIIHIKGNHDCFSKDTRILTKKGFKYYYEVKVGDSIPTVNLKNQKVEYQPIQNIIINKIDKGYTFETKTTKGIYSDKHRHLILKYNVRKHNRKFVVKHSQDLWNYKSPLLLVGSFCSGNSKYPISNLWLKLLAWILTDGNINNNNYITIYQNKVKFMKEIELLLSKLNITYRKIKRIRNTKSICGKILKSIKPSYEYKINVQDSQKILKKLNLKTKTKVPSWTWKLSDKQVTIFINELIKGDGTITTGGTRVLWGTKKFLEQIQALAITHSINSNLILWKKNIFYLTLFKKQEKICSRKYIRHDQRSIINYNDIMWDVTVPNHFIFTELNGKPLVTGNSNNYTKTSIQNIGLRLGNYEINLVHNPEELNLNYKINLVGHIHEKWKIKRFKTIFQIVDCINVGIDVWNFYPVTFEEIIQRYKKWLRNGQK